MTTPSAKQIAGLKQCLREALLKLSPEEQAKIKGYGQMLAYVNTHQASFVGILKQIKGLGIDPSKKNVSSFKDEPVAEEKKALAPPPPNFQKADARVKQLKSVSADALFAWLDDYPSQGLYLVGRDGVVYVATAYSCNPEPRPAGLTAASLVYVLNKSSGSVSIARDEFYAYGDVGSFQTPQELEAQQKKAEARQKEEEAAELEQRRWEAYEAQTGIYRDLTNGSLWYQTVQITYLDAPVRIAGDGRVYVGPSEVDKLYYGRLASHDELTIPVADVYRRVAPDNPLRVVDPVLEPFHRHDHTTFSHETAPITDFVYYADVLYQRLLNSGCSVRNEALYFDLGNWVGGGLRHLTVVFQGNSAAAVHGAIRAALEARQSPGARLSGAAANRWHVTIARNWTSTENINFYPVGNIFYPNGRIVFQDQQRGPAYYASIGRPSIDTAIGTNADLLTEDSLNTRLGW